MNPTEEQTYRDGVRKDIQNLGDKLKLRMSGFETDVRESLCRIEVGQELLDKNQKFTNGKVRKIIIALVMIAGIIIGQTTTNWHEIIGILSHIGI